MVRGSGTRWMALPPAPPPWQGECTVERHGGNRAGHGRPLGTPQALCAARRQPACDTPTWAKLGKAKVILDSGVFASLRGLTQKALQDGKIITQFGSFLAGRLQQGTRMFVAVLTHHIGQRMHVFLDGGMVQAPLQKY